MSESRIPYLDKTWPIVTGCVPTRKCYQRCWARLTRERFGLGFDPTFHEDALLVPSRWRKPRVVGVAFTGDLFGDAIGNAEIAAVYNAMATESRHLFLVLSKSVERMVAWYEWVASLRDYVFRTGQWHTAHGVVPWPLPNVWVGTSVSFQHEVKHRVPLLLQVPARRHWLSVEPLVAAVDLGVGYAGLDSVDGNVGVNWVVVAGESGPRARPHQVDWVRDLWLQCHEHETAFSYKNQRSFLPLDGEVCDWRPVP